MRTVLFAIAAVLACGATMAQQPKRPFMTDESYRTERTRIQNQYVTAKERCSSVQAHAQTVCRAEALAQYNVARAELRASRKPGQKTQERLQRAKAKAQYDLAAARCGDMTGSAKAVCLEEAKATRKAGGGDRSASGDLRDKLAHPMQTLTSITKPRPREDATSKPAPRKTEETR